MTDQIRSKKLWIFGVVIVAVSLLLLIVWLWLFRPFLPSAVRRQVSFVVLYPNNRSTAKVDRNTIKYDSDKKILTYAAREGEAQLIVTNQSSPDTFTDIPQTYDKVLEGMHPYSSFDSLHGKVSLTHPATVSNQVAVTNTVGTLMFVRTNRDLSDDQWRQFFNNLAEFK